MAADEAVAAGAVATIRAAALEGEEEEEREREREAAKRRASDPRRRTFSTSKSTWISELRSSLMADARVSFLVLLVVSVFALGLGGGALPTGGQLPA